MALWWTVSAGLTTLRRWRPPPRRESDRRVPKRGMTPAVQHVHARRQHLPAIWSTAFRQYKAGSSRRKYPPVPCPVSSAVTAAAARAGACLGCRWSPAIRTPERRQDPCLSNRCTAVLTTQLAGRPSQVTASLAERPTYLSVRVCGGHEPTVCRECRAKDGSGGRGRGARGWICRGRPDRVGIVVRRRRAVVASPVAAPRP